MVRKCGKAGALRRFMLQTFGESMLAEGEGVVDVAGGQGELSFLLANLNRIRATVVDPRPLRLERFARKLQWGVYHSTEPLQHFNTAAGSGPLHVPGHVRAFLDAALIGPLLQRDSLGFEASLRESFERALRVEWTARGMGAREFSEEVPSVEAPTSHDVERLLRGMSCIVGLHPDQAAGAAMDLALALNKPAAIVPCCVYQAEFPERRLPSGAHVRTPDDLVSWLLAKDPRLREAVLPFEGRNRVVFWNPRDVA